MRVIVVFEYKGIDPDSSQADQIVEELSRASKSMQLHFGADACWVDDAVADDGREEKDE